MSRILCLEPDAGTAATLRGILGGAGHAAFVAATGLDGLRTYHQLRPDVVVLALGLPDIDGFEVLRKLRQASDVPVLILTSRRDERDIVRGLRGGADDYLTKPFSTDELLARVEALVRRARITAGAPRRVYDDGRVRVDHHQRAVHVDDAPVRLTPTEFRLLATLVEHTGAVLSARQLLSHAWADDPALDPDRVKFAVLRLRRKLGWDDPRTSPLQAVRGFGYRYTPAAS